MHSALKRGAFILVVLILLDIVAAQQTPMHGWTDVTAVQGSITEPVFREDILTNQDGSWTVIWSTSSTGSIPYTLHFKRFDQNNQPGTQGEITMMADLLYSTLNDPDGNVYTVLADLSAYPSHSLKLAKIDRSGAVVFQRVIDNLGGNAGGSYTKLALGSDNQLSIIYSLYPEWRFARVNRDGVITTPPRSIQLALSGILLISDRLGNLYIFGQDNPPYGPVAYQKLNERDGSPIGNPVVMGTSAVALYDFAYSNSKLHFLWREDVSSVKSLYYSQYDTVTNQPVVPRQLLWSTQGQDRSLNSASLAVADDGSRINVVILDRDNQITRLDHRVYLMQMDNIGRITIPQTLMADMSMGTRPFLISKLAQVNDRPYVLFGDQLVLTNPYKIVAKIYDPQVIGPENPYMSSCNAYQINAPLQNGQNYFVGASFGTTPGIQINGRVIPLNADILFFLSPAFIGNNIGTLDNSGQARFRVTLPRDLPSQLQFYLAYVTFGQQVNFISKPKLLTPSVC